MTATEIPQTSPPATTPVTRAKMVTPAIAGELDVANAVHILPESLLPFRPTIMSYSASLFSTVVGFPLDSIKTRMQTHNYSNMIDCLSKTVRSEGISGLFRGITAPLLSSSVSKSIGVSAYTAAKPYAAMIQSSTFKTMTCSPTDSRRYQSIILAFNNAPVSFTAGVISGASCTVFATPFEFTKLFQQLYILMQDELKLNPKRMPKTTWEVAKTIRRSEGISGLYSGFRYHLLRDSVGSGLYFSIYETCKILMDGFSTADGKFYGTNIPISGVSIPIAGATSGVFSWILVFPIDTVKSLYQRDVVSNIIRGLALKQPKSIVIRPLRFPTRDMYKGLSVSVTRSVITSIAFFSCFEYLMKYIA
ncbi:hypothetical protein WICPIJ_005177 [Wickerhamomyces pijperi]|uniref:Uncharacterized protein n=1 Tax=Wickerhamomyces pijperi TaxID=599730 RepID=A0A9P8Q6R3_WICPI|nr:hypothetical protein WICPIJ_005177 [Wickerhamomyces pijperi]